MFSLGLICLICRQPQIISAIHWALNIITKSKSFLDILVLCKYTSNRKYMKIKYPSTNISTYIYLIIGKVIQKKCDQSRPKI